MPVDSGMAQRRTRVEITRKRPLRGQVKLAGPELHTVQTDKPCAQQTSRRGN